MTRDFQFEFAPQRPAGKDLRNLSQELRAFTASNSKSSYLKS
jgi:hypothetical protein